MRAALILLLWTSGCGERSRPPPPPPVADSDEPELPDLLRPGRIYRDAYERAKETITADNAAARLDVIEHDIDLEGGARDAATQ